MTYDTYRGLIFDLDGTLIDSMPVHAAAWVQVCREHGFEIDPEFIYRRGGMASYEIVQGLVSEGHPIEDAGAFTKRKIAIYRQHLSEVQPMAQVQAILVRAHRRGQRIAVGTGTQRINAVEILTRMQLISYVDALVTAEDVAYHKPHPQTFLLAAQRLGLQPPQCLVFEDAPPGIQAAANGGFDCVGVSRQGEPAREIIPPHTAG